MPSAFDDSTFSIAAQRYPFEMVVRTQVIRAFPANYYSNSSNETKKKIMEKYAAMS